MHKYRHILVGIDLVSGDDDPVLERASEIARVSGAEVSLLHVVEPFYNYVSPYVVEAISEWQEQTLQSARRKLGALARRVDVPPANQLVTVGPVRSELIRVAYSINADLILVGSHGRHGISLFLHGSVATDLISHANCDVLSVCVKPVPAEVEPLQKEARSPS